MKRLAVDPGAVRVGLARTDDGGRIAFPAGAVHRGPEHARLGDREVARRVAAVVRDEAIEEVVVGLPIGLDGREGPAARAARRLAAAIAREVDVPVVPWDERLTTVAAERALREAGVRGRDRRAVVDEAAAAELLQRYVDARAPGVDAPAKAEPDRGSDPTTPCPPTDPPADPPGSDPRGAAPPLPAPPRAALPRGARGRRGDRRGGPGGRRGGR